MLKFPCTTIHGAFSPLDTQVNATRVSRSGRVSIVTLVSGGYDSTLMSLMAHEEGIELFPLFVEYGQLGAKKEWEACQKVHARHSLPEVAYMDLSGFGKIIAKGLVDQRWNPSETAFVPGRNLLLALVGAAYAFRVHSNNVAIGLISPGGHSFPDQTQEFAARCEHVIEAAIGERISVLTPLIKFSKKDVIELARQRGVKDTYSCYAGTDVPCGMCMSCIDIAKAEGKN